VNKEIRDQSLLIEGGRYVGFVVSFAMKYKNEKRPDEMEIISIEIGERHTFMSNEERGDGEGAGGARLTSVSKWKQI
jgi:hypothetical protein